MSLTIDGLSAGFYLCFLPLLSLSLHTTIATSIYRTGTLICAVESRGAAPLKLTPFFFYAILPKCNMFPNQIQFGKDIAESFNNPIIFSILAVALTQSGKTGSMLSAIQHVKHDHVFIITGLSSVEWMDQTKARFPRKYRDCIFHRNMLHRFVQAVKGLKNVLIIIDENQIAFKEKQSIHNAFVAAGIMDLKDLIAKQVRIVHFTATPSNTNDFIQHEFSAVVLMKQDPNYISAFTLYDQGRILEYKDLSGLIAGKDYSQVDWKDPDTWMDVNPKVFEHIDEIRPFLKDPKYHIIRTSHSFRHDVTIVNFMRAFPHAVFLSEMDNDMDLLLSVKPEKHTFLFIKEKLRCAKTLQKDHLGVLYERITKKPIMDTILQGLVGRLTGYHSNSNSVVFSNKKLVQNYRDHWLNSFKKHYSPLVFIGSSF